MIDLDLVVDERWLQHYRRMVKLVLDYYGLLATAIRISPSQKKGIPRKDLLEQASSVQLREHAAAASVRRPWTRGLQPRQNQRWIP